jgi:hypothetical protein
VTEKTNPIIIPVKTNYKLSWEMLVDHFNGTPLECVFSIYGNAALLATALKHPAMHSLLELNQRYLEIAILFF